jgi:hypothetical protein
MKKTYQPSPQQHPHSQLPPKTVQILEKPFRHHDRGTHGGRVKEGGHCSPTDSTKDTKLVFL